MPQLSPGLRKGALTAHVTFSAGWLGVVVVYLVLAVAGLTSRDIALVRAAYLAMELTAWFALVPSSLASLVTGLVCALGSRWGLFRHYWVIGKLLLNVLATAVLLGYVRSIGYYAGLAGRPAPSAAELGELRNPTHVLHAGLALLVLLVAMVLAVYKPRGLTPYGQRRRHDRLLPRLGS